MPFTFSHPAIVLPLKPLSPKWFSMTGLIIGSVTPDFEYFIRMSVESKYSHTLTGLFWFDIPIGILLSFIFHNVVASEFIANLPEAWEARLSNIKNINWNNYFKNQFPKVCVSIIIGASSHIFWDGFTHKDGYFVQIFPILTNKFYLLGVQAPLFNLLQYLGTLVGGVVILLFAWKLPANKNLKTTRTIKYWWTVFAIAFIIVSIRLLTGLNINQYDDLIMTVISAGLISVILTSILSMRKKKPVI